VSRIILKMHDGTDEPHIVVGWDRPCASYFWQEFNKEPTVEQRDGRWKVTSYANKVRVYATKAEADEHKWDDWEEMAQFAGYMMNELPTLLLFYESLPPIIKELITDEVLNLLREHSVAPDPGSIIVNLTEQNATS